MIYMFSSLFSVAIPKSMSQLQKDKPYCTGKLKVNMRLQLSPIYTQFYL